jgi:TonB family protein
MPFAGIETGASDSAIKVAPTPPELVALTAVSAVPPTARLDAQALYSEIRPPPQVDAKFERVYDRSEVDQPPHVLSRDENPVFPASVRDEGVNQLRAMLIVTVGKHGEVTSAHVLNSSGKPEFDRIAVDSVRQTWVFSPGIKDGKPVVTLVQQPYIVRWSSVSPFSAQ